MQEPLEGVVEHQGAVHGPACRREGKALVHELPGWMAPARAIVTIQAGETDGPKFSFLIHPYLIDCGCGCIYEKNTKNRKTHLEKLCVWINLLVPYLSRHESRSRPLKGG